MTREEWEEAVIAGIDRIDFEDWKRRVIMGIRAMPDRQWENIRRFNKQAKSVSLAILKARVAKLESELELMEL